MSKTYFSHEALSNSGIKQILKSPRKFRYWTDTEKADSSDFRIGRALHNIVLEPERPRILLYDQTQTFQSKAGQAFLAANPDSICLTADEYATVSGMAESIASNHSVSRLIASCPVREAEIYGQELTAFGPIKSKAMVDAMSSGLILDLKTTRDDPGDFLWTGKRFGYDIQAAWYRHMAYTHVDGNMREFVFIVVEKNPPYEIALYQTKPETFEKGWEKCAEGIEAYGQCMSLNRWPARDTSVLLEF
jgi:hypothetical protein